MSKGLRVVHTHTHTPQNLLCTYTHTVYTVHIYMNNIKYTLYYLQRITIVIWLVNRDTSLKIGSIG